jgi:hypothetical protein
MIQRFELAMLGAEAADMIGGFFPSGIMLLAY